MFMLCFTYRLFCVFWINYEHVHCAGFSKGGGGGQFVVELERTALWGYALAGVRGHAPLKLLGTGAILCVSEYI